MRQGGGQGGGLPGVDDGEDGEGFVERADGDGVGEVQITAYGR